jgi:hypothetical protein
VCLAPIISLLFLVCLKLLQGVHFHGTWRVSCRAIRSRALRDTELKRENKEIEISPGVELKEVENIFMEMGVG